ncbi:MAG: hypothetical protein K5924_08410 [Chloroflexi bacterium]|nr:hypothetical protein [Chloroflexota bacterium]
MTVLRQPKSPELRQLYWRDEILQLLFWIEGEGLGSQIDADVVDRFLGPDSEIALLHLDRLVREGYLVSPSPGRFALAERGRLEGSRLFDEEFAALTTPSHGECGAECWCRQAPEEARSCAAQRA